ncbi:Bug family tripartite tricarboxylate transporter substrate binding protein [Reyranella sp.]|uniref:Bug family tripartite tricarboxylate transporter substrate binding protein n=1 Tax=Reyranella sp. TaxID=1929291 RepID=UPI003782E3EA
MTRFVRGLALFVVAAVVLAIAWLGHSAPVHAAWPDKPVRIVVPWSAGAITDALGRLLAQEYSKALGQQFVVENRPGAAGNIGAEAVANARPDGYTLLLTNPGAFVTNHFLYKTMPFAPNDFDVIVVVAKFPNALIVNKDVPANSVKELIDYAKANPGKLNGASAGIGTSGHLSLELLKNMAKVDIVHVPYQGAAPARFDLAAGRVQLVVDNIPSYVASVTDGSAKLLGVGTRERLEDFPNVPTIEEAGGLPGFQAIVWYALAAPKGTPVEILDTLNRVTNEVMARPDFLKQLKNLHAIPVGGSRTDATNFIKDETARWKAVITAAGVQAQ